MRSEASPNVQGLVLRNTLFLLVAQAVSIPVSILMSAVMARYLGAKDFGYLYLASTFSSFAFIGVEWGQSGAIPSMVARDRSRAAELLGTGIVWRGSMALVAIAVFAAMGPIVGWERDFEIALFLIVVGAAIGTLNSACQDTMRGCERTDIAAYSGVAQQLMGVGLVIPTLLLGGRLQATLTVQICVGVIVLVFVWRTLRRTVAGTPSFRAETLKKLLVEGSPFAFFGIALILQPNVDAIFLSRLAPTEAVGWLAVSRKLVGVLTYPASALITALYPTLCRLHVEDPAAFRQTLAGALRTATMLVVPLALSCALFPGLGVGIFSRRQFAPAEDDLRVLSLFVFLVYFSMVLGIGILAANKQRAWAAVQLLCVVVSLGADPLLVPWFQAKLGNGGLGICATNVASEVLMVIGGIWLAPHGLFRRALWRELSLAFVAGIVMVVLARMLKGIPSLIVAPIAIIGYVLTLWVTGALRTDELRTVRDLLARKLTRAR